MCNLVQGQESLGFFDRVHTVNYFTDQDLFDLIDHYLRMHDERESIAQAGKQKVTEGHSYMDRAVEILQRMGLS